MATGVMVAVSAQLPCRGPPPGSPLVAADGRLAWSDASRR
jgi:hypothetical protein